MSAAPEGLPGVLPQGERVLWQGRPCWRTLARRGFHLRKLAVYLGVLLIWYVANSFSSGQPLGDAALASLRMAGVAVTPLVLIGLYAWVSSRGTVYTVTTRRVVLRIGIAMPITFNLPFSRIESAGLKAWQDGHGEIALKLAATERLAYLVLWPHAKPRRMAHAEPMLRCIPDAEHVAQILARALAASADMPAPAARALVPAAGLAHATALA